MITRRKIEELRARLLGANEPWLSVYVPRREEPKQALMRRVAEALDATRAPRELTAPALAEIEAGFTGRTLALFRCPSWSERVELDVDLPVLDPRTGHVEARFGLEPWLMPLRLAVGSRTRVGVAYVDRERYRLFAIFLDEAEVVDRLGATPREAYSVDGSAKQVTGQSQTPARDDAHRDRQEDHVAEVRDRMYREAAERLDDAVRERSLERILVVGTPKNVAAFIGLLPKKLADMAVSGSASLPDPDADPTRVRDAVAEELRAIDVERECRSLEAVDERGLDGLDQVLEAIQTGRAGTLVVPWQIEGEVYAGRSGYISSNPDRAKDLDAFGGMPTPLPLARALDHLIPANDLDVAVLTEARARALFARHGGIAVLPRW